MVVVLTIGQGFQIVTTIEELRNVSTTAPLNNELATRVVRSIVSAVQDEVVKEEKVAFAASGNSVELLFGNGSQGSGELDVLAGVDLVLNLHHNPGHDERHG